MNEIQAHEQARSEQVWWRSPKILVLVLVAIIAILLYWNFSDRLSLDSLAERESELRGYQDRYPGYFYGLAYLIYVAVTGLSLPGAAALTLVYGWFFGLVPGTILVSFASTSGATLAFLMSRFLLRDVVEQRFGDRLTTFQQNLQREGAFYLFTLRLIPAVPFFVINVVMGLTPMRIWTFWWVSQLGMFAGTIVYVYAGSSVPSLQQLAEKGVNAVFTPGQMLQILMAFVMLGLFPLIVRLVMKRFTGSKNMTSEETTTDKETTTETTIS